MAQWGVTGSQEGRSPIGMVHCIEVLVVEDGLERFNEGGKAEGEEKDKGPDGPNDLHSSPSEGVSQP